MIKLKTSLPRDRHQTIIPICTSDRPKQSMFFFKWCRCRNMILNISYLCLFCVTTLPSTSTVVCASICLYSSFFSYVLLFSYYLHTNALNIWIVLECINYEWWKWNYFTYLQTTNSGWGHRQRTRNVNFFCSNDGYDLYTWWTYLATSSIFFIFN